MRLYSRVICFIVLTCTLSHVPLHADQIINKIVVTGNRRIGRDAVIATTGLAPGMTATQNVLDEALKKLFDLRYFSDVSLTMKGSTLEIILHENLVVNKVVFEGNKELSDDILKTEALLKPLQNFTESRLKKDTQRIQDLYRLKGHFAAKVTPKIIKREQNRTDVIFEIEEGDATVIRKIYFIGNKSFSESKLEAAIQTKETRWYRFFTTDDTYDGDRLNYDRELLRKFYLERGYADFTVKSAVAELSSDHKEFFITFTLNEGERYRVGKLLLKSELKDVNVDTFKPFITFKENDWYSTKSLDHTILRITDALGARGFAFVDVQPHIQKNDKEHTIDITLDIQEGPKAYIERIIIQGNERTNEQVIRRELRFFEGDPFNTHAQKVSKQRLQNLGFFKKIDIRHEPGNAPDKLNIIIDVEEERTGEISVGGGFSTSDGPLANINLLERNFRGQGQEFNIGFTVAKHRQEFDVSFTEPYFLNRELSAGVDLYRLSQNKYFGDSFTQKSYGGALRMGYMLANYLSQSWAYRLSFDEVTGIRDNASRFIKEQKGRSTVSGIGHSIMYDRRDNRIEPTEGYTLSMANDFAGVGGNVKYLRTKFGASNFYTVMEDVIWSINGGYGYIQKIGSTLRILDRFSLGDESLRGFQTSGVGPRDRVTKDALGGIHFYTISNEVLLPTPMPSEFNVKMAAFIDLGSTWGTVEPACDVIDTKKMRGAGGLGLRWKSPLGPIRIDFAHAFRKDKHDKTQLVHFGFSTRF